VKPDAVRYRYENAPSNRWRYSSRPDFGKESSAERQLLFSAETIEKAINDKIAELEDIGIEAATAITELQDLKYELEIKDMNDETAEGENQ
jgi:hypothetical protein